MEYTEESLIEAARRAFREGEASFDLEPGRAALLVIDMQDEFVKPGWTSSWIPEATRQVGKIGAVIEACRGSGAPVIYTVFAATHEFMDRPAAGSAMPNRFPELGSDPAWFAEGRVWKELAPRPGEIVIRKPSYGAFYDTPLGTILRRLGKDTIIVCGTLTNCCCGTTARQGYERGYKVVVGSDITSTYAPEMQAAELGILRFAFAKVMDSGSIISAFRGPSLA